MTRDQRLISLRRTPAIRRRIRYVVDAVLAGLALIGIAVAGITLLLFTTPPGWIILTLITLRIMGVI